MTRMLSLGLSTSVGAHVVAGVALVLTPLLGPSELPVGRCAPPAPPVVSPRMIVQVVTPRIVEVPPVVKGRNRGPAVSHPSEGGRILTAGAHTGAPSTPIDVNGSDWTSDPLGDDADRFGACWPRCFDHGEGLSLPGILGPPSDAGPVRAGGPYEVREPHLLERVEPIYPEIARRARIQGRVVLECVIGPDGLVRDVVVKQGNRILSPAAVEAVRQWRYVPTLLNGRPASVVLVVSVDFHLLG
jgi:TonB family protein